MGGDIADTAEVGGASGVRLKACAAANGAANSATNGAANGEAASAAWAAAAGAMLSVTLLASPEPSLASASAAELDPPQSSCVNTKPVGSATSCSVG